MNGKAKTGPMELPTGFYATAAAGSTGQINSTAMTATPSGMDLRREIETRRGVGPEVGVGYDFGGGRIEVTGIYNRASVSSAELEGPMGFEQALSTEGKAIQTWSAMVSSYIDISIKPRLELYAGGGIGIRQALNPGYTLNTPRGIVQLRGKETTLLGYQFKTGLTYQLRSKQAIFIEGFYAGSQSSSVGNTGIGGARIGTRWYFR